jgi:hypothetical protein
LKISANSAAKTAPRHHHARRASDDRGVLFDENHSIPRRAHPYRAAFSTPEDLDVPKPSISAPRPTNPRRAHVPLLPIFQLYTTATLILISRDLR